MNLLKSIRLKRRVAIIVSCFVFLLGCGGKVDSHRIKVSYLPMVSSLTHFVAQEKGFYKDAGIDVEGNPVKTSNLIAQDLATGNSNIGIELSLVPLLKQLESSSKSIRIFSTSSITSENGFDGIVVKRDSSIKELQDLAGKKVGVFPGTTAKNSLLQIFRTKFPAAAFPMFVELDPPLHLQSLENGDIDALFTYEPTLTLGKVKSGFVQISTSIYAMQQTPNPIGVAAANSKWVDENPHAANAFFQAIDKAVEFIRTNPEEAKQILARSTNLDADVAKAMHIMPLSKSTEIDFKSLEAYLRVLKDLGEINELPSAKDLCIQPR